MKFLCVFVLFVVAAQATPYYMPPGLINSETQEEYLIELDTSVTRIASGNEAKKGEYPEFCYLSIRFFEKSVSCGCWIYAKQHVITTGRCVIDCSEGLATNVTVTIPALSGKDGVFKVAKIFTYLEFIGVSKVPIDNGYTLAVIKLKDEIPAAKLGIGKDTRIANVGATGDASPADLVLRLKDYKFRACGVGVSGNHGERSKGVVCSDVDIITDQDLCKEQYAAAATEPFTSFIDLYCLRWPARDNNACVGDFGGPVYAYKLDSKGAVDGANQIVACTLLSSPNVRKSSPCLDGHITYCIAAAGKSDGATYNKFINSVING